VPNESSSLHDISFDLTESAWFPVQRLDGIQEELSLKEVFVQAENLRRVVGDIATQEFALLRLLLAILHDAIDGPYDLGAWQELWDAGIPADRVTGYLTEHRDRFDLMHPRTPFFQVAGMRTAQDEVASLDRIVADVPNGEPFFTMRAHGTERLSFAEAARWLVHAHAYDTSGIKTGAAGDTRVKGGKVYPQGVGWAGNLGGVFVEGDDLRQTLLLNLVAFDTDTLRINPSADRPAWRHEPPGPGPTTAIAGRPAGPRDLYTWQSRRIRLHADTDGVYGVVLAYGDPLSPANKHRHEPMTAWRRSPAQEKKTGLAQVYLPREHEAGRSAWRGLGALVAGRVPGAEQRGEAAAIVRPRVLDWAARLSVEGDLPVTFMIRARLIGAIYGTQQSVIDEVVDDAVTMPLVLLHKNDPRLGQAAIDAVADAEAAVTVLGDLAADLAAAAGAEPTPLRDAARWRGFGTLDGPFRTWLATLQPGDDPHERRTDWQRQAYRATSSLAAQLLAEVGDAAWQGRVIETRAGQKLWLTAPRAELSFRTRLREALPAAAGQRGGDSASAGAESVA
jgi:CRISPR system Cascade subunit CasA